MISSIGVQYVLFSYCCNLQASLEDYIGLTEAQKDASEFSLHSGRALDLYSWGQRFESRRKLRTKEGRFSVTLFVGGFHFPGSDNVQVLIENVSTTFNLPEKAFGSQVKSSGAVFTILHFLGNLGTGP